MLEHRLVTILPATDLQRSVEFYARLGFRVSADHGDYLLLSDEHGAELHLRLAKPGSLDAETNPFGMYLYVADVDALAHTLRGELIHLPTHKPWACMSSR